jgi:disulfide bond formation protein DsbB
MRASQVADVLGTLATASVVLLAVAAVLRVASPPRFGAVRAAGAGAWIVLAAVVAAVAMAASLWFSEEALFLPCKLCWYQRIAMYPLAILLPIAAIRRDLTVRVHALVLAGAGLAVSAWHNSVETFEWHTGGCDPSNPCTIRWVEGLGFWTIPRLAFVAFALVFVALLLERPTPHEEPAEP